ncbi:MAG: DNA repair protein RecN, partial [Anaerolineae bacterium]|nr:DNA repair protein RecN [Anaerolineae bacterium]
MLRELHIQDFAIIDTLQLALEPGFNILTGETGAGKSILIDAVALLLGGRADVTAIRAGMNRALIEGLFLLEPEQRATLAPLLEQEGLDTEQPGHLWLSRELRDSGRSVARVNGAVVSVTLLREIAEKLIDIHGQSEHLSLMRVSEHLNLLDRFADLESEVQAVGKSARELRSIRRELQELRKGERERMQRVDLLRFQVKEIQTAALSPEEEVDLESERTRLANAEQLSSLVSTLLLLLQEGTEEAPAIVDLLGQAQREMGTLARIDTSLAAQEQALDDLVYQTEDLARVLRDYLATIDFSPRRLRQVEERLALIHGLKRKYGGSVVEIMTYAASAARELHALEHSDERIAELEMQERALLPTLGQQCLTLSAQRQEAAVRLSEGVERELGDLRMDGAQFGVSFHWKATPQGVPCDPPLDKEVHATSSGVAVRSGEKVTTAAVDTTGIDHVEFLVAPNVGEGLKPMARIASGGETARLMLALKTVLSRADRTPTLICDEIDQGIGGRVGAVVGAKLWRLTVNHDISQPGQSAAAVTSGIEHQVLCITHLPQLAGFGDAHYRVHKVVQGDRTLTQVTQLDESGRIAELAQMLGTQGESGIQGAQDLLAQATAFKAR